MTLTSFWLKLSPSCLAACRHQLNLFGCIGKCKVMTEFEKKRWEKDQWYTSIDHGGAEHEGAWYRAPRQGDKRHRGDEFNITLAREEFGVGAHCIAALVVAAQGMEELSVELIGIKCRTKALDIYIQSEKKAGPDDPRIRFIGLHLKRPAYPIQSTRFQNESKDFSALLAYVVHLPAYVGTRLASKVTFSVCSIEEIFKPVKRPVLLTCLGV